MNVDHFFVVLPSDSSMDVYPDNKVSSYITHFPSEIKVDPSKWEVGLQEIQFPHSWYNVKEGHNVIIKRYENLSAKAVEQLKTYYSDIEVISSTAINRRIVVPPGNYNDVKTLVDVLNKQDETLKFQYDEVSRTVSVTVDFDCSLDWNNSDIAQLLGFQPSSQIESPRKWEFSEKRFSTITSSVSNITEGRNVITKTFYNLHQAEFDLLHKKPDASVISPSTIIRRIEVPLNTYGSLSAIIAFLNRREKDGPRPMKFQFDKLSKRMKVFVDENCSLDWNNSDIARLLGFKPNSQIRRESSIKKALSRMSTGVGPLDSIYVYTDIVQNQLVGDFKVPLLRVLPVKSKFGDLNWVHYDRPHFLKLSRENINSIEINIRNETGELVSFEAGKVLVTLVFRRARARFYQQ